MTIITEEALFADARSALVFALKYRSEQFATSTLGRLAQGGTIGSGRGLHGLDGAGTAALLRARFDRLEDHHAAALIARCADVADAPWSAAVGEVTRFVEAGEAGSVVNGAVLAASVRKFFGERQTAEQIADKANMHRVTAQRQWQIVKAELERIEAESWAQWRESLFVANMIKEN